MAAISLVRTDAPTDPDATPTFAALRRSTDYERRRSRSGDPEIALGMQLEHLLERHDVELLVVTDLDGAPLATAGDPESAIALADFAARVCHEHLLDRDASDVDGALHWQSMVTNRGYVIVEQLDAGLRRWCVAAQSRFALPDRAALARAVAGAMRILSPGLAIDTPAPIPLVSFGGWGDWEAIEESVVDGED